MQQFHVQIIKAYQSIRNGNYMNRIVGSCQNTEPFNLAGNKGVGVINLIFAEHIGCGLGGEKEGFILIHKFSQSYL